jgi:hypothetical protein
MEGKRDEFVVPYLDEDFPMAVKFGLSPMRAHIITEECPALFTKHPVRLVSVELADGRYIKLDFDQVCGLVLSGPAYTCSCVTACHDRRYPQYGDQCTLSCPRCRREVWRVRFDHRLTGFGISGLCLCVHIPCEFRRGGFGYGLGTYVFDCTDILGRIRHGFVPDYSDMTSFFSRLCRAELTGNAGVRMYLQHTGRSPVRRRIQQLRTAGLSDLRGFVEHTQGLKMIVVRETHAGCSAPLTWEGQPVVFMSVVFPFGPEVMSQATAIVQDMTWRAVRPGYGLMIPLAVRSNVAYPIAMSIAPGETARAYESTAQAIDLAAERAEVQLDQTEIPHLGDEGSALNKYCNDHGILKDSCFVHLIRGVGTNSILAELYRRALYASNRDIWYTIEGPSLVRLATNLNCAVNANETQVLGDADLQKFFKLINYDDIARELARIGHGIDGNESFLSASQARRMSTVALWANLELGSHELTPEWIADFRTKCWLRASSGALRLFSFGAH